MRYFPISIDTKDKKVLVIGGGKAAFTKIKGLMRSEFLIYCLAMKFSEPLKALARDESDRLFLKECTVEGDFPFMGYDYLVLATGNGPLEKRLANRAKTLGVPALATSPWRESDFHLLAQIEKGPLTVAIQSGNPTVSRAVKKDVERLLANYSEEKIEIMNTLRQRLIEENSPHIAEIMAELWEKEEITNRFWEDRIEDSSRNERKPTGDDSGKEHRSDIGRRRL